VTSIAGGRRKTVALSDGRQLTSHIVVLSTGSAPNVGFLKGSGVKVDKGIIVDKHMRTNVAGIYAAGDVAQGPGLLGGPKTIHPIQTTAVEHGRIAGANMAGQESVFAGSLMTSILDVAGLHCASIGRWKDKDDVTEVWDAENRVYRKLVWDADRLIGGIILGPAGNASLRADTETLIELVRSRVQLGSGKRELQEDPSNLRRLRDTSAAEPNRQRRRPSERISRRRATATG
jgi:NAD(P)H-nitrite reductase large subunit